MGDLNVRYKGKLKSHAFVFGRMKNDLMGDLSALLLLDKRVECKTTKRMTNGLEHDLVSKIRLRRVHTRRSRADSAPAPSTHTYRTFFKLFRTSAEYDYVLIGPTYITIIS